MKTWADLKHGDVIKDAIGDTYTIIDILPHSALLSSESSVSYWCELSKIQHAGWQIVQPEEEEEKTGEPIGASITRIVHHFNDGLGLNALKREDLLEYAEMWLKIAYNTGFSEALRLTEKTIKS